eukprot:GHVS01056865.1.p1 GENE.GHVS01056865.1~~GHVS01056865.1.p1  ORF type:complete len:773 (+),score=46.85 GHVS01056865.1:331-2319(+)
MDPVTLSVVVDKCVSDGMFEESVWSACSWQAQQMSNKTVEPSLGHIYRSFAQANWYDKYFVTTYLGRIERRLHMFQLLDCANVIEAMANPNFWNERTLIRLLEQVELLLTNRDDLTVEDLSCLLTSLRSLNLKPQTIIDWIGRHILRTDLTVTHISHIADIMYSMAWLEEPNDNLMWCLTRELVERSKTFQKNNSAAAARKSRQSGEVAELAEDDTKLAVTSAGTSICSETVLGVFSGNDISKIAFAMSTFKIRRTRLVSILVDMLVLRRFQLESWELSLCIYGFSRLYVTNERLYDQLAIGVREKSNQMTGDMLAQCLHGFLRARRQYSTVANVIIPQLVELFDELDVTTLVTVYDGLSRAFVPDTADLINQRATMADGHAETVAADLLAQASRMESLIPMLAGHCVKRLHPHLKVASARELSRIARASIVLQPELESFMKDLFDQSLQKLHEMNDRRLGTLFLRLGSQDEASLPEKYAIFRRLIRSVEDKWTQPGGLLHASGAKSELASVVLLQVVRALGRCETWFSGQYTEGFLEKACLSLSMSAEYLDSKALVTLPLALLRLQLPHRALLTKVEYYIKMKRYDISEEGLRRACEALEDLRCRTGRWTGTLTSPERRPQTPDSSSSAGSLPVVQKRTIALLEDAWGRSARTNYAQHNDD